MPRLHPLYRRHHRSRPARKEHNSSVLGAKYTKSRRPCTLVYSKEFSDRSAAQVEESRIKNLSRSEKHCVIATPQRRGKQPVCRQAGSVEISNY